MTRLKAEAIVTRYWRPGADWLGEIVTSTRQRLRDGDFLVISEKAISTASGNVLDENTVEAGFAARFLSRFWVRFVWGYFLSLLCGQSGELIYSLRSYPVDEGGRHKQVALRYGGLLQALMFGSEAGIDGSNVAFSLVSLPLANPQKMAERVVKRVELALGKSVTALIVDTDKTYSLGDFHFAARPNAIDGIHCFGGVFAYVVGRAMRLRRRATPVAVAGEQVLSVEDALEVANLANRVRGFGSGRTVWQMAQRFGVGLGDVSWEMLGTARHKPVVIVRRER